MTVETYYFDICVIIAGIVFILMFGKSILANIYYMITGKELFKEDREKENDEYKPPY